MIDPSRKHHVGATSIRTGGAGRFARFFVTVAVLLALLVPMTAAAQDSVDSVEDAAPAAIPGLSVARDDAVVNFPQGINFALDAATTDPIDNVELMYRIPGLETYSVELPRFTKGSTELQLEHVVDLRAGELPPGVDLDYHWRITESDGDIVETPEQTLHWTDSRYSWTPLEGPHVTVYAYDADANFQRQILNAAERTISNLKDAYGAEPDQPIRIWAYANKEDFYGALAPNSEPWIAGAAYPDLHLILAILPPGDFSEVTRVVPHEISHQVLAQATINPFNSPPQWLDEGLAVYWQESGRDRFYAYALNVAAAGQVPPLRTLNGTFGYDRLDATAAYALSLSAVMYILDTWGDEGIANLIAALDEGVTYEDAVQQGLGISFDELDRQWREDLIADAKNSGAAGITRFGDDPAGPAPWLDIGGAVLLASGTLVLAIVVLIAVVAWVLRRRRSPVDDVVPDNLHWREWPEGLEPSAWQAHSG